MRDTDGSDPVTDHSFPEYGLTKREHFAALMMSGLLAGESRADTISGTAITAVICADALIRALNDDPGDCDK